MIAYVVGKLVASLVATVLEGVGFNRLFVRLGFDVEQTTAPAEGELNTRTPAGVVGYVVLVAVMLFAATEAANMLGFEALAVLIAGFTVLAGRVLLGLVLFGVGLYLANLAYSAIRDSGGQQAVPLAVTARVAILVLAGAMALRQMGLADSIINLAFGLVLGAVAVAAAIAFGIGGRDVAREQLERLRAQLGSDSDAPAGLKPKPEATPEPPRTRGGGPTPPAV